MSVNIFVIIICVLSLILGASFGVIIFKIYNKRKNKKLLKNAKEVLDGDRENIITIDGQKHDATKFIIKDDDGKEKLIDLKGGKQTQNGKTKDNKNTKEENIGHKGKNIRVSRKDSISDGKKKRNIGIRRIRSRRYRRFG